MGWDWRKFGQIVQVVAPITLGLAGVPPIITNLVVHGIQVAEQASEDTGVPKTGAEKKSIAMDAVVTGLNAVNAAKPGTVDVAELTNVVSAGIDETIAAVNAAKNIPVKH